MPYKTITHKNGFTEIIAYDLTEAEERAQMARMTAVKMFPSVNSRLKSQLSKSDFDLTKSNESAIDSANQSRKKPMK
jgi:hypothetical protein